ncbi:transmembrane secretion effector [Motilibacter rhizosphaerae]|uniref:Transmembrane secretion effector n=1 Tax=Motilibacter rhizosphaerae TaxID=598652 RepID=A0A4Q7N7H5_9ACTN|nr:MFS transporter [Motilibacter rhizosphaerae]RZS77929.1 transmembrane secretion effector [Motilibacter rhizosphaerae]
MTLGVAARTPRRALPALLVAQGVSTVGTRMSVIAVPWFVLVTTGSAARTGLVAFAELAAYVVSSVAGSPVVDRVGPRRASLVCDGLSGVAAAAVPVLHAAGMLHLSMLLVLVALLGAARGPGDNAKFVLLPDVAAGSGTTTATATAFYEGVDRGAALVGAPLGGVLVAEFGAAPVVALDAASFVAALGCTLLVPRRTPTPTEGAYLNRFTDGLRFLRRDGLLLAIAQMLLVTNLLDTAFATPLLPLWVRSEGRGAGTIGVVFGAAALGATVSSLAMVRLSTRLPRRATFAVGLLLAGFPRFVATALDAPVPLLVAVVLSGGLAAGLLNPILATVQFERIPEALRARVLAVSVAVAFAGMPLGGLVGALLASTLGVHGAMAAAGAAYLLTGVLPLGHRWRAMNERTAPGATRLPA